MAESKNAHRVKVEFDEPNRKVIFQWIDKTTEKPLHSYTADLTSVAESLEDSVFCYGGSKLLMDRTSQLSASASPQERAAGMAAVLAHLANGEWTAERKSTGPTVSAEVQALAEIKGVSVAAIQATLRTLDADRKARVLANVRANYAGVVAKYEEGKADTVDLSDI